MADGLDISLVLRLVDRLSAPARQAGAALDRVAAAGGRLRDAGGRYVAATAGLDRYRRAATAALGPIQRSSAAMGGMLRSAMGIAAGAGLSIGIGSAVQSAIGLEEGMADIRKVTDELNDPKTFAETQNQILAMSTRLGVSAIELTQIASAAASAGIPFSQMLRFTEDTAKAQTAWGLSAAQTGDYLGKISGVYQLDLDQARLFADGVNVMADTTTAKAGQLLDFVQRVGGTSSALNISARAASAFGATMISAGEAPEVAATGFNALLGKLGNATEGSQDLKRGLEMAGLTAEGVEKAMRKDAMGAILQVIQAASKSKDPFKTWSLIGGQEYADSFLALSNAYPRLLKNIQTVNDAQEIGGSVQREYAARIATTAGAIRTMRTQVDRLGIQLGGKFLPPMNEGLESVNAFFDTLDQRVTIIDRVQAAFGGFAEGFGAVSGDGGLGKLSTLLFGSTEGFAADQAGLAGLAATGEGIGAMVRSIANQAGAAFGTVQTNLAPVFDWLRAEVPGAATLFDTLGAAWDQLGPAGLLAASSALGGLFEVMDAALAPIMRLVGGIASIGRALVSLASLAMANPVISLLAVIAASAIYIYHNWDRVKVFFDRFWAGLQGAGTGAWTALQNAATRAWQGIVADVTGLAGGISARLSATWQAVRSTLDGLFGSTFANASARLSEGWNTVTSFVSGLFSGWEPGPGLQAVWDRLEAVFGRAFDGVTAALASAWAAVRTSVAGFFAQWNPSAGLQQAWDMLRAAFGRAFDGAIEALTGAWMTVTAWVDKLMADWKGTLGPVVEALVQVLDPFGIVRGALAGFTEAFGQNSGHAAAAAAALDRYRDAAQGMGAAARLSADALAQMTDGQRVLMRLDLDRAQAGIDARRVAAAQAAEAAVADGLFTPGDRVAQGILDQFAARDGQGYAPGVDPLEGLRQAIGTAAAAGTLTATATEALRRMVKEYETLIQEEAGLATMRAQLTTPTAGPSTAAVPVNEPRATPVSPVAAATERPAVAAATAIPPALATPAAVAALTQTIDALKVTADGVETAVTAVLERIRSAVAAIDLTAQGARIMDTLATGMLSRANAVAAAASSVAQRVRDHFPQSPAKEGPLRDLHRVDIPGQLARAITPEEPVAALQALLARMRGEAEAPIVGGGLAPSAAPSAPGGGAGGDAHSGVSVVIQNITIHAAPGANAATLARQIGGALRDVMRSQLFDGAYTP